jgi:hypothetical protein
MRLLTAISVASLVVSIAALVLVLGLYAELEKGVPDYSLPLEKSESDAPPMNLSEHQVISLVKNEYFSCWFRESDIQGEFIDFKHTESASFRPGGIWVVEAESSWTWPRSGLSPKWECIYVVDDSTGKVTSKVGETP